MSALGPHRTCSLSGQSRHALLHRICLLKRHPFWPGYGFSIQGAAALLTMTRCTVGCERTSK
jgi:hypothetical protein